MLLVDLLILFVVAWLALSLAWVLRRRRRAAQDARWEPHARALPEGGHVIEIVCPGEPAQTVKRIPGDLDWDALGTEFAAGLAEAEARAATLNSVRRASS
jgi:hypothetical protein